MIYAIRAVGTEFIKFGRAAHVGKRMVELDCACPFDLEVVQTADWQNGAETAIHRILADHRHKGEWFRDCELAQSIIQWMGNKDVGLARLHAEVRKLGGRPEWLDAGVKRAQLRIGKASAADLPESRRMQREAWWKQNGKALEASITE